MKHGVAIIGVGVVPPARTSKELSYKEMMYVAARAAYAEAGIDPRRDVDSFISCGEDLTEGVSIFDEYVPDQLGGAQRPVHTVGGDGIQGLGVATMLIRTGRATVVVVESHSKASNILGETALCHFATDPIWIRPLGLDPRFIAGLEARAYLDAAKTGRECLAHVVAKNRSNAKATGFGCYGEDLAPLALQGDPETFAPLTARDFSGAADAAFVMVVAAAERVKSSTAPIAIRGIGWIAETPNLEMREWGKAPYATLAAQQAYAQAGIMQPTKEIQLFELDDTVSYKELQHAEAVGLCDRGQATRWTLDGATRWDGPHPINPSGGSLGIGHLHEATGLCKVWHCVQQLRGTAGARQVKGARTALAQSWRGIPTATGAVIVLSSS